MKSEGVTGLGILKGISFKITNAKHYNDIMNGLDLVPGQLKLSILTKEDKKKLRNTAFHKERYDKFALLEWRNTTYPLLIDDFNLIKKCMLAFHLLKSGDIFLDNIYYIFPNSDVATGTIYTNPIPASLSFYEFNPEEKDNLIEILNLIQPLDFKKGRFRIACDRFERAYYDYNFDDKIVDLCIAFEALFLKEDHREYKGKTIGLACSMLLGQNKKERNKIYDDVNNAFIGRNNIVHGKPHQLKNIRILLSNLEDYLRKSILRLIP